MSDGDSLKSIDSLLFQCALRTRELSQKKNELNQQVKVYRDNIDKAKCDVEATKTKIKSLEEGIEAKQNVLTLNKSMVKSLKSSTNLSLHFDQTLKAESENKKAAFNRDREEYEKRIASYRASLQSYQEYYYNNPLTQNLVGLKAENREIEARIKNYDEQTTSKQEELDILTAPVIRASSSENPLEGVSEQHPVNEPEKQQEQETLEDNDTSSQPVMEDQIPPDEVSGEETEETQDTSTSYLPAEEGCSQQKDEQDPQKQTETEEEDHETGPQDPSSGLQHPTMEEQFTVLEIEQAMEVEMDECPGEDQASHKEAEEALVSVSQASSQDTSQQASPARPKPDLAAPTFPFMLSPGRSSQASDSSKSPAFAFNLHSEPCTPAFFGFGAQDEDPSSPFTSSFFGEKKAAESKSSMEFLFNQPEPSEEFQFSFNAKSSDTGGSQKDKARDDFPFSFNF